MSENISYICPDLQSALATRADKITADKQKQALIDERARTTADNLFGDLETNLLQMTLPLQHEQTEQADRFIVSSYVAGMLALIGEYESIGWARTQPVILARDIEFGDVTYDTVTTHLSAGIEGQIMNTRESSRCDLINPNRIRECKVRLSANSEGIEHTLSVNEVWSATYDMPDAYKPARRRYDTVGKIIGDLQRTVSALSDANLNPQFRTLAFIESTNPELWSEVINTDIPIGEIGKNLYLPSWLKERGVTSSLIQATA